jgi:hypothetical protein
MLNIFKSFLVFLLFPVLLSAGSGNSVLWWKSTTLQRGEKYSSNRIIVPERAFYFESLETFLKEKLSDIPTASLPEIRLAGLLFEIPGPDGMSHQFKVIETPVLEKSLGEKYPEILGDVTQERKERICRGCFEHMLRNHPEEVPVSKDSVLTGVVRHWDEFEGDKVERHRNICVHQPHALGQFTPDDGDEYLIE